MRRRDRVRRAERGDGGEDLGDGLPVFRGSLIVFRRLAQVFFKTGLEQAVIAKRDGDAADGDGLGGRIEQRDFLTERPGGGLLFLGGWRAVRRRLGGRGFILGGRRGVNLAVGEACEAERE